MELDLTITALMIGTLLLSARVAIKNRAKTWGIVQLVNMLVLGAAWLFARDHVAVIAGPLWALTVLTPGLAVTFADRLAKAERFGPAYALAKAAAFLHPNPAMRLRVLVLGAQRADRHADEGALARALDALEAHPAGKNLARLLRWRAERSWDTVRAALEHDRGLVMGDPTSLSFYLRALGELGDTEAMCAALAESRLTPAFHPVEDQVFLFAAAFTGRVETTRMLVDRRHPEMPADIREYWLLTARHAAGEDVDRELRALGESAHLRLARTALARIDAPPAPAPSPDALRVLEEVDREARAQAPSRAARPTITVPIVLVNTYAFLREIPGGTTDGSNLYALGALSLKSFVAADWVRLETATLLHYGFVHLMMNMLGLLLFGPELEAAIGRARVLVVYVGSGLLANVLAVVYAKHTDGPGALLVGASGCAMGVIGALLVRRIATWRKKKTPLAQSGVRSLAFVFLLQIGFDAVTPRVAGSVHVLGAITGALLALVVGAPKWETVARPTSSATKRYAAAALGILVAVALVELAFAKNGIEPPELAACEHGDTAACAKVCADPDERWSSECNGIALKILLAPDPSQADMDRARTTLEATCDAGSVHGCKLLERESRDTRDQNQDSH